MKKIILSVSAFIFTMNLMAQAPEKMTYQAVIRNSSNALVTSAPVGMRISILQGSATGTSVYTETQTTTTNNNGLATVMIGGGTVVSGDFATIDWSNGLYFIKTETDPAGGTNYTITGTSQLLSVPYALHAKTAESVLNDQVNDADADPTNELQNWSNLPGIPSDFADNVDDVDDADADPMNEIELPSGGNNAQVLSTDGAGNYTWVDQPANELPAGGTNAQVLSTDGAGTYSWVDQTASNLPNGTAVGQTAYWDGTAWVVNTNVFNNGGNVGVGTASPTSKLTVNGNIQVNNSSVPAGISMENTGGTAPVANFDVNFRSTGYNTTYKGGSVRVDARTATPTIQFLTRPAGSTTETIAMAISESNNVGIGTSAPAALLSVGSSSNTAVSPAHVTQISGNSLETMALQGNTVGTNLSFYKQGSSVRQAAVQSQVNGSGSDIKLYTTSTAGVADQVRMTIKADGNVGIGTTTPNAPLQFPNTLANRKIVLWEDANNDHEYYGIGVNGSMMRYQSHGVNGHAFYNGTSSTTSTELMRILANGNVGIGTATPTNNLHVAITTLGGGVTVSGPTPGYRLSPNAGASIAFGAANIANEWAAGSVSNDAVLVNQHTTGKLLFATGSSATARMAITSSGNVGIGTTAPSGALHVNGANGTASWTYLQGNTGAGGAGTPSATVTSGLMYGWNATNVGGESEILFGTGAGTAPNLYFGKWDGTTKTQLMSINANGNVGIGTIAPARKLHVNDAMRLQPIATAPASPSAGDMYFSSVTNKLMVFDGSVWQACW